MRTPRVCVLLVCAAVSAIAVTGCSSDEPTERLPPRPLLQAHAGELQTVPSVQDDQRDGLRRDLEAFLVDLYSRGFLPPQVPPATAKESARPGGSPTPVPTPIPRPPVEELFADHARPAMATGAFNAGPDVHVLRATLRFSGVATFDNGAPTSALLAVGLDARGRLKPPDAPAPSPGVAPTPTAPAVKVRHAGQLLLRRSGDTWRVAGFDVSLSEERAEPAPGTPSASPVAAAYMPADAR